MQESMKIGQQWCMKTGEKMQKKNEGKGEFCYDRSIYLHLMAFFSY